MNLNKKHLLEMLLPYSMTLPRSYYYKGLRILNVEILLFYIGNLYFLSIENLLK